MERIKSHNGKHDKMLTEGYCYNVLGQTEGGKIKMYRCDPYNMFHCGTKLRVSELDSTYISVVIHTDAPDPAHCEANKVKASIETAAQQSSEPPRKNFTDHV